ncbi:hypothetical protein KCH_64870 [Kitasatospora cheerisanensis KCTC 2395]|uniref:Uncharacterized protein n=1 Tax=Kitasatospora cheerisanensis KCTC 2395 TaxID=1348663 RepID=A0A066YKV0_9ACTN|nr:hypothetical protein KCH_64870 [Kitasatospora cheerisanensis KCTC 2395]
MRENAFRDGRDGTGTGRGIACSSARRRYRAAAGRRAPARSCAACPVDGVPGVEHGSASARHAVRRLGPVRRTRSPRRPAPAPPAPGRGGRPADLPESCARLDEPTAGAGAATGALACGPGARC